MIRIWTPALNHRMRFAANCLFTHVLGVEEEWVSEPEGAHIVYDKTAQASGIHIAPSQLIQTGVLMSDPEAGPHWHGTPTLAPSGGELGFDLLGAIVFLAARMEEYGDPILDDHGRFPSAESWMGRHQCLEVPLIDCWALQLREVLKSRFPELEFPERKPRVVSTIDVDSAYAYRGKGFKRTLGGFVNDIRRKDWQNARMRWRCIRGKEHDPFDTYETILQAHARQGIAPLFFFLVADYSPQNINLSYRRPVMRALVLELTERSETGVHPGYSAADSMQVLAMEIGRMSDLKLGAVAHSRYHYLRGRFPESYARLAHLGIRNDHTLGFADAFGFRMGTCTPLPFFDLQDEVVTPLILHPTALMDTTAARYLNLTPEQTVERARNLAREVHRVGGTLALLWHNETWSEAWHWKGWSKVPEKVLSVAQRPD